MSIERIDLLQILEIDEANLKGILAEFRQNGILKFFERMLALIDSLNPLVQELVNSSSASPFTRSADGVVRIPWDLRLRMHMLHSAWNQYAFAISHLLRAQASEVHGHVRRAIEGAGIAYLSKSEPDIAELYGSGDKKLRNRTQTNQILPKTDQLTADLNRLVREASGQVHNNFRSFAKRLEEEIQDEGAKAHYKFTFHVYEADNSTRHFWEMSHFILESGYFVARLLAESFNLPKGDWHKELQDFKTDLERYNVWLMNIIEKNEQEKALG